MSEFGPPSNSADAGGTLKPPQGLDAGLPNLSSTLSSAGPNLGPHLRAPRDVRPETIHEIGKLVHADGLPVSGWREWVGLPSIGIRSIKAKIDSGARSSCLHAFDMELFDRDGVEWVRFAVHPIQRNDDNVIWCQAPVHDRRKVRSSNGVVNRRVVIRTELKVFGRSWPIDLTLNNRDAMGFRMLIGREAVRGRFLIDSGGSYFAGRPKRPRNSHKS